MAVQIRSSWVSAWLSVLIGILTTMPTSNAIERAFAATAKPPTLTGAHALKSPQIFLTDENGLLNDGSTPPAFT